MKWWRCLLVLVLILSDASAALAQANVYVASVNVAGQNQVLRYPTSRSGDAGRIENALQTAIPAYEKYWNAPRPGASPRAMDFRVFVDVAVANPAAGEDQSAVNFQTMALPTPSVPAVWAGQAESTKTNVCDIQLYDQSTLYSLPQVLEFEVARDVARCYLLHYAPTDGPPPDWWFKGLSEWMAVQVYAPPPSALPKLRQQYQDNYNQSLTSASDEALYFWEFMLGERLPATLRGSLPASLPDIVNGLKSLPTTITFFTPDLFYAYARVAADNGLLWQPTPDDLAQQKQAAYFPDDVELDLEENSIVIQTVGLPSLQQGEGIQISAADFEDNGVLAGVSTGAGALLPLTEGAPLVLCDSSITSVSIVAGRGPESGLGGATVNVSKLDACTPPPNPTSAGAPASCIVGTWNISFPPTGPWQRIQPTGGTYQFTFNPDGTYRQQMQDYKLTIAGSAGSSVTNLVVTGKYDVRADPDVANRYEPTQWTFAVQPGANEIITLDDGVQYSGDVTQDWAALLNEFGAPPEYFTCDQNTSSNTLLKYVVKSNGADLAIQLTRAQMASSN